MDEKAICEDCETPIVWGRCTRCNPYEIEYCTNTEMLVSMFCEGPEDELEGDAQAAIDSEFQSLDDLALDGAINLVGAKNQRILFHGWNGAHFSWRHGHFGSFETLPEKLRKALEAAIDGGE